MRRYDITDSLIIKAERNQIYQAVINEIEGKTTWSFPYLKFIQVDGFPCEDIGSQRWLTVRLLGRPKMLTKTECIVVGEKISVLYIEGDCIGTGNFEFNSIDAITEVTFRWSTTTNSLLFHIMAYIFPVALAHSLLVKLVLRNLSKFVAKK